MSAQLTEQRLGEAGERLAVPSPGGVEVGLGRGGGSVPAGDDHRVILSHSGHGRSAPAAGMKQGRQRRGGPANVTVPAPGVPVMLPQVTGSR